MFYNWKLALSDVVILFVLSSMEMNKRHYFWSFPIYTNRQRKLTKERNCFHLQLLMELGFESYFHGIYNRNKKRLMSEAWKLIDLQEMKARCWLKKFHLLWQKENFGYATKISNHFSLKRFQGKLWIFSCLSFFNLIFLLYFTYVLHFQS